MTLCLREPQGVWFLFNVWAPVLELQTSSGIQFHYMHLDLIDLIDLQHQNNIQHAIHSGQFPSCDIAHVCDSTTCDTFVVPSTQFSSLARSRMVTAFSLLVSGIWWARKAR